MTSTLERVRMCVAEAGYDPAMVRIGLDGRVIRIKGVGGHHGDIPLEVVWRAFSIGATCTACLACFKATLGNADCLADRRLVLDCGRER